MNSQSLPSLRQQASRFLTLPLASVLLAVTLPSPLSANFDYINFGDEIEITGYTGSEGAVVIPEIIEGLPVKTIGPRAFENNPILTSVTIPDSVISIEARAFEFCPNLRSIHFGGAVQTLGASTFAESGLTNVVIPGHVINLGRRVFYGCASLTNAVIHEGVGSISEEMFGNCTNLVSASIGSTVTNIGRLAFGYCTSLSRIDLGSGLESIGASAFYACTALEEIALPDSLLSIGGAAFVFCSNLTSLRIPNSVSVIGSGAFRACERLTGFTVDLDNLSYASVDGVLFDKSLTTLIQYPPDRTGGQYAIPDGVTGIGNWAFYISDNLTEVTVADSVVILADYAFDSCRNLSDIQLGNAVSTIGDWAFAFSGLTNVNIPKSVSSIGSRAFYSCTNLVNIQVESGSSAYRSVDGVLFDDSLTMLIQYPLARPGSSYIIPETTVGIGEDAFAWSSLASITVPVGVNSIGRQAIYYNASLRRVYFLGDAPIVGSSLFSGTPTTIYYLSGTTGWTSTFAGRPAVLWNPRIPVGDSVFGIQAGQFSFMIEGAADIPVAVEACDDLANPSWIAVTNLMLSVEGTARFTDQEITGVPRRFYRFRAE